MLKAYAATANTLSALNKANVENYKWLNSKWEILRRIFAMNHGTKKERKIQKKHLQHGRDLLL